MKFLIPLTIVVGFGVAYVLLTKQTQEEKIEKLYNDILRQAYGY